MNRTLLTICLLSTLTYAQADIFKANSLAKQLGWIDDPLAKNLCEGYYLDKTIKSKHGPNSQLIDYVADKSHITKKGVSALEGHVKITQGDKQITANTATLFRNPETNKPKRITLSGKIAVREPGGLIYAKAVNILFHKNTWQIFDVLYRFSVEANALAHNEASQASHKVAGMTAWGNAKKVQQTKPKVWDLYNATYTTCKPTCNIWHLKASHIHLNKNTQIGTAKNTVLYVKNVPVFWMPYLRFPLTSKRTSGLLAPNYGTSSSLGANLSLPLYWNMAPNYDAIITPIFTSKRNILFNTVFRYLGKNTFSKLKFNLSPNDSAFMNKRRKLINENTGKANRVKQVEALESDNSMRYYINLKNATQLNQHLFSKINYTHVSDDYYMEDYFYNPGADFSLMSQLNQQLQLDYYEKKWRVDMKFQHYQTLHPLDQADVQNQYSRLPEIDFSGTSGYTPYHMQFSLNASFTDFNKDRNPFDTTLAFPTVGDRINLDPLITLPLHNNFFFVKPALQMDLTAYSLNRPNPSASKDPTRVVPIFDIDSGMYFDKHTTLFSKQYIETLEPHIYYLYVPYRNQNNLPLFDTVDNSLPLSFNYDQMFVDNRFSDIDRIGDANQLTLAMTTQFRDAETGMVKATASLGEIYYFQKRQVLACTATNAGNANNTCQPGLPTENTENLSPLAGQLSYNLDPFWKITGDLVYNPKKDRIDNQTYALSYSRDNQHIINLSYTYARNAAYEAGSSSQTQLDNLEQTDISAFWPINNHWHGLGEMNFSLNRHRFQSYLYGVEYDSCCWALRAVMNRAFVGLNPTFDNNYDNRFYLQIAFNGLTSLGTHNPSSLLSDTIDNYHDRFGKTY